MKCLLLSAFRHWNSLRLRVLFEKGLGPLSQFVTGDRPDHLDYQVASGAMGSSFPCSGDSSVLPLEIRYGFSEIGQHLWRTNQGCVVGVYVGEKLQESGSEERASVIRSGEKVRFKDNNGAELDGVYEW